MVCGSPLEYLKAAEDLACTYCGRSSAAHVKCPGGHFICDSCHAGDLLQMIENTILSSAEKDPVLIAEQLMNHPSLPMLGCEHALIAAGALAAALRNSPYAKITDQDVREVLTRTARQAISGYCGLTGVCGIAPAMGACFSVFLAARCGSDSEQKIVMEAVIRVSQAIAELTGPSCCKAYVRTALDTAVSIFSERFGIVLPLAKAPLICRHESKHPHGCREEKCPYYKKESKDIFADSIHLPVTTCHS
ncbi:MAG: hypothetical protein A2078_07155 [Nitrospirae bacterium GWC2_57_9]|nr:MAG: hypothetical protein A2078_07155 [Nitrospirae bacterium GWC2_57_9]